MLLQMLGKPRGVPLVAAVEVEVVGVGVGEVG
jgi:hypothetical protein